MKVLEIKNIQRDEIPLYYRRKYVACAVLEMPLSVIETPIAFTIETGPAGNKEIDIDIDKKIEYPIVPLLKSLKVFVLGMDEQGLLL